MILISVTYVCSYYIEISHFFFVFHSFLLLPLFPWGPKRFAALAPVVFASQRTDGSVRGAISFILVVSFNMDSICWWSLLILHGFLTISSMFGRFDKFLNGHLYRKFAKVSLILCNVFGKLKHDPPGRFQRLDSACWCFLRLNKADNWSLWYIFSKMESTIIGPIGVLVYQQDLGCFGVSF